MPNLFGLNGPPVMNEFQRGLLTAGLGAVPVVGPVLGGVYSLGRIANGIYNSILNHNLPQETNSTGFIPSSQTQTETNSTGFIPSDSGINTNYLNARNDLMRRIMASPDYLNATRPAFSTTAQQAQFPGSAIGPIQGPSIPWSATRGAQGLGTPNPVDTSIPGWAASNYSEILKRNQI